MFNRRKERRTEVLETIIRISAIIIIAQTLTLKQLLIEEIRRNR